jgi:hypothetical protein
MVKTQVNTLTYSGDAGVQTCRMMKLTKTKMVVGSSEQQWNWSMPKEKAFAHHSKRYEFETLFEPRTGRG